MPHPRIFPFEPRTTAHVRPGDFWAIPTRRGGWYCCGRVLATGVEGSRGRRTALVVGLMDWCEPHPPTTDALAGAVVTGYGAAHIKTIRETGGPLLGHRPFEPDGGLDVLLAGRPIHDDLVTWGYASIEVEAHALFGRHFPGTPSVAAERPAPLRLPWYERD